ncbi:hypothetical protein BGZ68_001387, partial [Mortierella alpina]
MEETQAFRLTGTADIVKIPIQHVDGQNVVYWDSIEKVFPGVKCVKNGDVAIPRCIKSYPSVVLDIVVSSPREDNQAESSAGAPSLVSATTVTPTPSVGRTDVTTSLSAFPSQYDNCVEGLRVTSASTETPSSDIDTRSSLQVVKLASRKAKESDVLIQQQELSAKMDYMIKSQEEMKQLQKAFDAKQEEMNQLQKAADAKQEEMNKLQKQVLNHQEEMKQMQLQNREEMKQLQIQALGQLAVIQARVQAVLTQTYELHEYPIPRLFVVLPQDLSRWDALDPFSNKFRFFFLCECGEHTKSIDSKSEIHVAKHEGYEITRPTEFFQLYGAHVHAILKMLKFGISVAGVAVPAISHLVRADVIDQAATYLKVLKDFEPMMGPVLDWMDKISADEGGDVSEFAKQMESKEALAGADLRKLDTFLKAKDGDKVLGNLYRTVTDEGHVKWVCIDHYRENYLQSTAKDFQRTLDAVGGTFDKNIGRVQVTLRSKVLAEQFFSTLGKARSVYELNIVFDWASSTSDLEQLEVALKKSRVAVLRLCRPEFRTSFAKVRSTSTQYDVIFRIRDLPNMKVLHIAVAKDHVKFLDISHQKPSRACKFSCELLHGSVKGKEFGVLVEALKTNSTLTTLDLRSNSIGDDGAKALAEALKTNKTVAILDLRQNSIRYGGAQALSEALKSNSTLTTLDLRSNAFGSSGAQALSEALKTNSTLTTLYLQSLNSSSGDIGDKGAQALSEALKINRSLTTLD